MDGGRPCNLIDPAGVLPLKRFGPGIQNGHPGGWPQAVLLVRPGRMQEETMAGFGERVLRSAKLDARIYEEIEADSRALGQAMGVVVLSSVAAGIGAIHSGGYESILFGTISALFGWFVWAYLTYLIGTRLLPEPQTRATPGELLRTIGFSSSPGLIRVLGIIPGLAGAVFLAAAVWMFAAMVVAVRQALDYGSTLRAVGVVLIGWLVQAAILAVFLLLLVR
jgi:hypothetical protein